MESEVFSTPKEFVKCCDCGCSCSLISTSSDAWIRSVKRKYDEFEAGNRFYVPEIDIYFNAKVQIENECIALREMVCNQQQAIQDLHTELEEERNASSSAASEAMGMILRLQREKAEIQMESRQFKRFAEEKMAHDQQEILVLEDLLYKREQAIHSLTCEVQAYKHRMMSYGLTEEEAEGGKGGYSGNLSIGGNSDTQFDIPAFDYPPLRCNTNETPADDEVEDVEKYAFGETPRAQEQLRNLEFRIYQMERNPSSNQLNQLDGDVSGTKNIMEKVMVGHSPMRSKHLRRFSTDSLNSTMETPRSASDFDSPRFNTTFKRMENISEVEFKSFSRKMDTVSEYGDDMSDRVYTIDSVHNAVPYNGSTEPKAGVGICDDFVTTPRDSLNLPDIGDPDIMKLYMRLQALEADRESMRQAIISMRTDKAQLVLLKEIAQHLCKEMSPEKQKKPIRKPTLPGASTFMSVFKWVSSFVFWRKKAHRSKYMHGMSPNNVGLLMLLDKGFQTRQWRCISSAQV